MPADHQPDYRELPEAGRISAFNQSEFARLLGMEITEAYDGYARVRTDHR
jgi:acyl-coenzyme A thioesterase PaaI-like protein